MGAEREGYRLPEGVAPHQYLVDLFQTDETFDLQLITRIDTDDPLYRGGGKHFVFAPHRPRWNVISHNKGYIQVRTAVEMFEANNRSKISEVRAGSTVESLRPYSLSFLERFEQSRQHIILHVCSDPLTAEAEAEVRAKSYKRTQLEVRAEIVELKGDYL